MAHDEPVANTLIVWASGVQTRRESRHEDEPPPAAPLHFPAVRSPLLATPHLPKATFQTTSPQVIQCASRLRRVLESCQLLLGEPKCWDQRMGPQRTAPCVPETSVQQRPYRGGKSLEKSAPSSPKLGVVVRSSSVNCVHQLPIDRGPSAPTSATGGRRSHSKSRAAADDLSMPGICFADSIEASSQTLTP